MHGLWPLLFSTRHSFPRDLLLLLLHSLQHRSRCETAPGLSATAPNGAPGFPGGSSVAQGAPPRPGAQPSSPSRRRVVQPASRRPQDEDPLSLTPFKTNSNGRLQGRQAHVRLLRPTGRREESPVLIAREAPRGAREWCEIFCLGPAAHGPHELPSVELAAHGCLVSGCGLGMHVCAYCAMSHVAIFRNI